MWNESLEEQKQLQIGVLCNWKGVWKGEKGGVQHKPVPHFKVSTIDHPRGYSHYKDDKLTVKNDEIGPNTWLAVKTQADSLSLYYLVQAHLQWSDIIFCFKSFWSWDSEYRNTASNLNPFGSEFFKLQFWSLAILHICHWVTTIACTFKSHFLRFHSIIQAINFKTSKGQLRAPQKCIYDYFALIRGTVIHVHELESTSKHGYWH